MTYRAQKKTKTRTETEIKYETKLKLHERHTDSCGFSTVSNTLWLSPTVLYRCLLSPAFDERIHQ